MTDSAKRGLTEDESALLTWVILWGSDGYPIQRLTRTRGWTWAFRSIAGPPVVFHRRRDAVESFERFLEVLRDAKAGRI